MKIRLSYFLLAVLLPVVFQSCSNNDKEESYAEWRQENEQFIDDIKNNPEYLQASIPQGPGTIYYQVIKEGTGDTYPLYTSQVKVHYKGYLIDNTVFQDSSEVPYTSIVSSNVAGFATALQYMKEGDKWKIYIPWNLGYGVSGSGSVLPYSTLIFEVELIQITKLN